MGLLLLGLLCVGGWFGFALLCCAILLLRCLVETVLVGLGRSVFCFVVLF